MNISLVLQYIYRDWSNETRLFTNVQETRINLFKILDFIGNLTNKEKQEIIHIKTIENLVGNQTETIKCLQYLCGHVHVLDAIWVNSICNKIIPNDIVQEINLGKTITYQNEELTAKNIFLALQISKDYYTNNHNNIVGYKI